MTDTGNFSTLMRNHEQEHATWRSASLQLTHIEMSFRPTRTLAIVHRRHLAVCAGKDEYTNCICDLIVTLFA